MNLLSTKKQPAEILDYDITYGEWLVEGDTIDSATASVETVSGPSGSPLAIDSVEVSPASVKVWVSGGLDGAKYKITVRATTIGGRLDESEMSVAVKDF